MNRIPRMVALFLILGAIVVLVMYLRALQSRQVAVHPPIPTTPRTATPPPPPLLPPPTSEPAPAVLPPVEAPKVLASNLPVPAAIPVTPVPTVPENPWQPVGLSGGGAMFTPAISPLDANRMMLNCDMSGAYITTDGGRHWRMINCNQLGGNTRCRPCWSPVDANTIYAAGGWNGRLKISHDCGLTWASLGDIQESLSGAIAVDGGPHWEYPADCVIYTDREGHQVPGPNDHPKLVPDNPPHRLLVGTQKGALISRDGGQHFLPCEGVHGAALAVAFDPTSTATDTQRVCFVATTEGIWRSDDCGIHWHLRVADLPLSDKRTIVSFAVGANAQTKTVRLYCAVTCTLEDGKLTGGLYRSDTKGESWQRIMNPDINVDTQSYDEWADGSIPQYTHLLTTDANPDRVYAFNRSTGFWPPHHPGVYRSDDAGKSWRATLFLDPRFKGQYNVEPTYHTANMQKSYQEGAIGAAIAPNDPDTLIRVGGMNCYITHDGGKSWFPGHTRLAPGEKDEPQADFECNGLVVTTTWHYYIDPHRPATHYIAYTDIGFGKSTDAGKTWRWWQEDQWPPWTNTTYELAFDPAIPGKIWGAFSNVHDIPNGNIIQGRHKATGPGGVALSTDFADHWSVPYKPDTATGLPLAPVCSLVLDPQSPQDNRTLYAGVFDHGVYQSTDGGKTWTHKSTGLGDAKNMRVYRVILHPDGTLFAVITGKRDGGRGGPFLAGGVGVYRSTDHAATWEKISTDQPWLWCKDLNIDPRDSKILYVGVCDTPNNESGGLWRTLDGGKTWGKIGREAPETFGGFPSQRHPGWIYMTLTEGAPGAGLWLSRDDGKTWQPFLQLPFHNIMRVLEDPADPDKIYLTTFGASVYHGPATPAAPTAEKSKNQNPK